jgi:hypothetical protein
LSNKIKRIIKAGKGNAVLLKSVARLNRNTNQFTLVIHDEISFNEAKILADKISVPCYPSQSIADYIMECVWNPMPLLPIDYYNKLLDNKNRPNQIKQNDEPMDLDNDQSGNTESRIRSFMFSYKTYLTYSNINKQPMVILHY